LLGDPVSLKQIIIDGSPDKIEGGMSILKPDNLEITNLVEYCYLEIKKEQIFLVCQDA